MFDMRSHRHITVNVDVQQTSQDWQSSRQSTVVKVGANVDVELSQTTTLPSYLDSTEFCSISSMTLLLQRSQICLTWMRSQQQVSVNHTPQCRWCTCVVTIHDFLSPTADHGVQNEKDK